MDGNDGNDILATLSALDPVAAATSGSDSIIRSLVSLGGEGANVPSALPSRAEPTPEQLLLGGFGGSAPFTSAKVDTSDAPAGAPSSVPRTEAELKTKYPSLLLTGAQLNVQNVVSMFNLGTKVDLQYIGLHAKNAEYNPKRFAAVVMRIREPKTTALIFASGKVVVTGADSEENSKRGSKKFAKIIVKMGYPAKFKDFKIHNMVGSSAVNFPIRLEMLAADHGHFCSYEPELFPGLIYRMESPKVVLLIFVSGKIVFTGGRSREDLYMAFDNIYPVLLKYDKNRPRPGQLPPAGQHQQQQQQKI